MKFKFNKNHLKVIGFTIVCIVAVVGLLYLFGLLAQIVDSVIFYRKAGIHPDTQDVPQISTNFFACIGAAFSGAAVYGFVGIIVIGAVIVVFNLDRIEKWRRKNKRGFIQSECTSHGSAKELSFSEIKENFEVAPVEDARGVIIGETHNQVVCVPRNKRGNKNIAIVGSSGTGKSRAVIRNALYQAILNGESVIVTDPKGELFKDSYAFFETHGYTVRVLNLIDLDVSDGWNPMDDIDIKLNKIEICEKKAEVLAKSLIINTKGKSGDEFWDNVAENLLKGLILYVALDVNRKKEEKNLGRVYELITMGSEEEFCMMLGRVYNNDVAKECFNTYLTSTDSVRMSTRAGLATRLGFLQGQQSKEFFSSSDINLEEPAKSKCAYYVITSDNDMSKNVIMALFFTCLMRSILSCADSSDGKKCKVPVNFVLDEFNNIGKLGISSDGSDFARFISTCRSRDISVMLAIQGIGQLINKYGNHLWEDILNNCDTQIFLGCNDLETAHYFSDLGGDVTVEYDTYSRSQKMWSNDNTYTYGTQKVRRALFTPEEIMHTKPENLKCFCNGLGVMELKKFDYSRHPAYPYIVEFNANEYEPWRNFNHTQQQSIEKEDSIEKGKRGIESLICLDADEISKFNKE